MDQSETAGAAMEHGLPALTDDAIQVLRQASHRAEGRAVELDDLLAVSALRNAPPLPRRRTRLADAVWAVLARAKELADAAGDVAVDSGHLAQAAREVQARAAGLDLNRLRFARFLAQREYGERAQLRLVAADDAGLLAVVKEASR
jgi:hypothetical protein